MSYSLIIPIFNEEKTLKTLLSQIETLNDNIEIILINDGSYTMKIGETGRSGIFTRKRPRKCFYVLILPNHLGPL